MASNFQGVIFDLFGTLVQVTEKQHVISRMRQDLNMSIPQMMVLKSTFLLTEIPSIAEYCREHNFKSDGKFSLYDDLINQEVVSVEAYEETYETLDRLKNNGIRLGCISNISTPYKKAFFNCGLGHYFDEYIFSCEERIMKPDIRIYQRMVDRLDLPANRIVMIGDNLECDYYSPKKKKISSILLDRENKSEFTESIKSLDEIFKYIHFYKDREKKY